jgi:hypothetical protein
MYSAVWISLSCLAVSCLIGAIVWMAVRDAKRRKKRQEEQLKRRVKEVTGQDFVKGFTTVKDLEEQYGKKG